MTGAPLKTRQEIVDELEEWDTECAYRALVHIDALAARLAEAEGAVRQGYECCGCDGPKDYLRRHYPDEIDEGEEHE